MSEKITELISEKRIQDRLEEIADDISKTYEGESVTIVCILKGAVVATVELAKKIKLPVEFEFMDVSSYGDSTVSSGELKINKDLESSLEGKNVIISEDIVDTGRTLSCLIEYLKGKNPKSLRLFALFDKTARREFDVKVDWKGFDIPDEFIVGFGLDYAQRYRNLPYIGVLSFD